jgi:hypothetical protein
MRKRCKRKPLALINPIEHAISGARVISDDALMIVRMRELQAIEAFAKGTASLQQWDDLAAMLNIAETMARNGIGIEVLEVCKQMQDVLIESARRFEKTKRMGTNGDGLKLFRKLYQLHDLQRLSVARAEYEKMIRLAKARVMSGHSELIELT